MPIEKSTLRRQIKQVMRAMPPAVRTDASARLARHLAGLLPTRPAGSPALTIAAFLPLPTEPDLCPWYLSLQTAGHTLAFPLITGPGTMEFRAPPAAPPDPTNSAFRLGPHGLREPDPARCPVVPGRDIDWVLVPGLAFAAGGARLGRGAGFYDRWLAGLSHSPLVIGIALSPQIQPALPTEPHDRLVDFIATENGWIPGALGIPETRG